MEKKILMSNEELRRARVLRNYLEKVVNRSEAAKALGLSERQVSRLANKLKEEGEACLQHKNTGRKPKHAVAEEIRTRIIEIRGEEVYKECNFSHFRDILEEKHGIKLSYKAVYSILKSAGYKSPKKHRRIQKHHRRKRKEAPGALLQIDATPYEWFGDGIKYALHASIDDATGEITGAYFTKNECLCGYFEVMRQTCMKCGIPLAAYSDKHTIFRSPNAEKAKEKGEEAELTQFGRAMEELGISLIYAHSPQAKGRIERLWVTLQSRLPIELKLNNITNIQQANEFMSETYIAAYNERFHVLEEDAGVYVPFPKDKDIDLILCRKEERKLDSAGVFKMSGQAFQILDKGFPIVSAGKKVEVLISVRKGIHIRHEGNIYSVIEYIPKEREVKAKRSEESIDTSHVSHLVHGSDAWKMIWHAEGYDDSLKFLYGLFFRSISNDIDTIKGKKVG